MGTRSGSVISYSDTLINELEDDHLALVKQLQSISLSYERKDFYNLRIQLDFFRETILEHISKEVLKLYVYLLTNLYSQPEQYKNIRELRKAMDAIVIEILNFFDKYNTTQQLQIREKEFGVDLKRVISMLKTRIKLEEELLFPMYEDMSN